MLFVSRTSDGGGSRVGFQDGEEVVESWEGKERRRRRKVSFDVRSLSFSSSVVQSASSPFL